MSDFIGIDFSGGARPWWPSVTRPTVWLATVKDSGNKARLLELKPVQSLGGNEPPYDRLLRLLTAGDFEAAAIDAPFSLPLAHLPQRSHAELLRRARALPNAPDRPFPSGASLVALGESVAKKVQAKPLRQTEAYWAARGVNTRSTMWMGPRSGAPIAAACLRLLERVERPLWPWVRFQSGILVEAFPAAQLRHWGLPHQGYSRPDSKKVRESILAGLRDRLQVSNPHADIAIGIPDALDAIIAAFAAVAVANDKVAGFDVAYQDGVIAVVP
jgi:Protein of unknown function (DUF429)